MRKTLFASAAVFGLALAGPAFAQGMTPEQYLKQAQVEVQAHHTLRALTAINNAENAALASGAAEESGGSHGGTNDPPVIRQIGKAREAVQQHHWQQAETYITEAMTHPSTAQ